MKVLLIEDDNDIAELVEYNLKAENFQVETCQDGQKGLDKALQILPDLIVLDLMLPTLNGLEICKELKNNRKSKHIPILMLTAKGDEVDRIVGFELGADDYLTKPFSPRELVLRLKSLAKRAISSAPSEISSFIEFGILSMDTERHEVKVKGQLIKLTALEFRLLQYLFENKGRVATRDMLLDRVWGYEVELNTRTVDTHIKRLREKLGDAGIYVETLRGVGYRFLENPSLAT